uniref:putative nuclease HARBI1 n=1 Tax=Pristiophorus japonicus TaxID=55135 RepID=UPI00398EF1BE
MRRQRQRQRKRPYSQRRYLEKQSYLNLSENACLRRLRFQKEVIDEICQLIKADLQPSNTIRNALSIEVKVTAALAFYASGSFQASTGDICHISQHAAHCCIRQLTEALYARRMDFVSFPMPREAQTKRTLGFARNVDLPKVQGAIDCTHIALKTRLKNADVFRKRKGFHSLNVQLVVVHNQTIMTVNATFPGNIYDVHILCESTIPDLFANQPEGHGWMLGDKRYGLSSWLMTHLHNPVTEAQKQYNESHIVTHNIVEKTIGVLKKRFRCLDHSGGSLQYHPDQVVEFIVVCCMLHNLVIKRGQVMPDRAASPRPEGGETEEPAGEDVEEEGAEEDAGEYIAEGNQPGNLTPVPTPPPEEQWQLHGC